MGDQNVGYVWGKRVGCTNAASRGSRNDTEDADNKFLLYRVGKYQEDAEESKEDEEATAKTDK